MRTFTINNITYVTKTFDFNLVCQLEDYGVSLEQMGAKPMSVLRAYLALCADITIEEAGALLQAHVIAGGKLDDLSNTMAAEMEESDFFRSLSQTEEQKTPEVEKEAPQKTTRKSAKA